MNNVKEQSSLKIWKADSSANLTDADHSLTCDISSELEVLNALKRRGAAYELAKLMSFEIHEKIVNHMFLELQKEPLEGFKKVTLSQIAAADREIHSRFSSSHPFVKHKSNA